MKKAPRRLAETLWTVKFIENSRPMELVELTLGFDFLQGCGYLVVSMVPPRDNTDYSSRVGSVMRKLIADGWKNSSRAMKVGPSDRNLLCEEFRLDNHFRLKETYLEDMIILVVGYMAGPGNMPDSVSVQHEFERRIKTHSGFEWIGEGDIFNHRLLSVVPKQ